MSQPIDAAQVRRIAKLARLNLTADEVTRYTQQLGDVLKYVEKLNGADTAGVEPLAHPLPVTNVLRDDTVQPSLSSEQALANAPAREGDFFKVPAVLDGGSA